MNSPGVSNHPDYNTGSLRPHWNAGECRGTKKHLNTSQHVRLASYDCISTSPFLLVSLKSPCFLGETCETLRGFTQFCPAMAIFEAKVLFLGFEELRRLLGRSAPWLVGGVLIHSPDGGFHMW